MNLWLILALAIFWTAVGWAFSRAVEILSSGRMSEGEREEFHKGGGL